MNDDLISRRKAIAITWEKPQSYDPINVCTEIRERLKEIPASKGQYEYAKKWLELWQYVEDLRGAYKDDPEALTLIRMIEHQMEVLETR